MLYFALTSAILITNFLYIMSSEELKWAIPSSLKYQEALEQCILLGSMSLVFSISLGSVYFVEGVYTMGVLLLLYALLMAVKVKKHIDDDNWYNNQRQRLSRKLEQFRERLTSPFAPRTH